MPRGGERTTIERMKFDQESDQQLKLSSRSPPEREALRAGLWASLWAIEAGKENNYSIVTLVVGS